MKKDKKNKVIIIRVDEKLAERSFEYAKDRGCSLSKLWRKVMRNYLRRHK